MATIYYIIGFIFSISILFRMKNSVKYLKSYINDPNYYKKERSKNNILFIFIFLWTIIGLFTDQYIWYIIYIIAISIISKILNRKNSFKQYSLYHIIIAQSILILNLLFIFIPCINFFYFKINIIDFIIKLF